MGDSPYKPLANILNKAQGRVCKETGEEIDVGGDVVKVREHCDRLRAENERLRKEIETEITYHTAFDTHYRAARLRRALEDSSDES